MLILSVECLPYSGKLSREKTFTNFAIFRLSVKVFYTKFRHATPIMWPALTFRESFLRKMLPSYWSVKVFSLEIFPLYGIKAKGDFSQLFYSFSREISCDPETLLFINTAHVTMTTDHQKLMAAVQVAGAIAISLSSSLRISAHPRFHLRGSSSRQLMHLLLVILALFIGQMAAGTRQKC